MALPINIKELLNGNTVEWDRIELKEGWNPEEIIHSICAFANDINNWGGGYIFVGVAENDGLPVLPPKGISVSSIDRIQKELLSLTHQIQPFYAPVSQPYVIDGKHIFVIWVPGGDNRPYKVPTTLGAKGQKRYYVRRGSNSVLANIQEEKSLLEMAKRIPFDDRVNHHATLDDLNFGLIREFLEEVKSDLRKEAMNLPMSELAQQMRIVNGPPENLLPINVSLLFFAERPDYFFKGAVTEVVIYKDDSGKNFEEIPIIKGPIHKQLKKVLDFLSTQIVIEKIVKTSSNAQANRVFNYPFEALEEVIANAFYHRSYELDNPIEINIWPDRIEVLSFPGPLPPVTQKMLKQRRIVARNYRNRRVGDFFKELKLTEGRASGFPTIYDGMEENGSPVPIFETDQEYGYFLVTLPVHDDFLKPKTRNASESELQILLYSIKPRKRADLLAKIKLSNHQKNYTKHIIPMIEKGWLAYTEPDKLRSPNQHYITTEKGKKILG